MNSRIGASIVAGLISGLVFGVVMQMMTAPASGSQVSVIALVGQIVSGTPNVAAGWAYHLFNSAVIGAAFGWLLGTRIHSYGSGTGLGAAYGFAWWILGGLILMPMFLGMSAFAPVTMPEMQMVALGSLIGHLVYGVILGGLYVALFKGARVPV